MLEKLIHEIRNGGTLQPAILAQRLNTSVPMIQAMLEDLERRGLLRQVDTDCGHDACGGCPMTDACTPASKGRLWMLNQK